jgi:hypothetical protein
MARHHTQGRCKAKRRSRSFPDFFDASAMRRTASLVGAALCHREDPDPKRFSKAVKDPN